MSDFDDHEFPPEFDDVAKQLRDNRHEASALELDQAKQRILQRATKRGTRRLGRVRAPTFVTAAILALSIGGGSAAAFSINLRPVFRLVTPHATHHASAPTSDASTKALATPSAASDPPVSAAARQYGNPFEQFLQSLLAAIGRIFSGGGGGGGGGLGGLVSGILAAIAQLLSSLGL